MAVSGRLFARCIPLHLSRRPLSSKTTIYVDKLKGLGLRRHYAHQPANAFAPTHPADLPPPRAPRRYPRLRKLGRWTTRGAIYLLFGGTAVYLIDRQFTYSSLARSCRTLGTGLITALDYKLNFRPDPWIGDSIEDVHRRNAERLFNLLHTNGGLYLKIGQAIAMQSAVLPPEFQKMFGRMFDDAPQNSWADVTKVIQEDFGGRSPEEVFGVGFSWDDAVPDKKGVMERTARASASVAQVHWARLADGREVAIKIQKREISQQVGWDLWTFKVVSWIYSKWFEIPFYSLVPYITERLELECDFSNEAHNSEMMAQAVSQEPRLKGKVYIPKVYHELSSKRVMTAEWIEGVRLWDKESLTGKWPGRSGEGSPGYNGKVLPLTQTKTDAPSADEIDPLPEKAPGSLKPKRTWWKDSERKTGLGLSLRPIMDTMVSLFSAQMFIWGLVHCDPHPGNILIRRLPGGSPELVLLDHGLYISMSPKFRDQYARFWRALMTFDNKEMASVVHEWGVNNVDIFASATLLKPYSGGTNQVRDSIKNLSASERRQRQYELQEKMRKGLKEILGDENKWPRELLFIGRNLRIVQGNNQYLGSPVNRIRLTAEWASKALTEKPNMTFAQRLQSWGSHVLFKFVLFGSDLVFWGTKIRQKLGLGGGMEDEIEKQMKSMAKDMGIELNHNVFEG